MSAGPAPQNAPRERLKSIAARFVASTNAKARSASTAPTVSASHAGISPVASGRRAVRSTNGSNLRSAQSLTAHPAERVSIVPIVKITTSDHEGDPCEASHNAESVGHSSSRIPIGLSRRTRRS